MSRSGSLCSPMHRSGWHGCANAIRPAASAHFSCRLHRADDTLHVADGLAGEPTGHVCRHGVANGVSRAPSARFGAVLSTQSTRTRGCRAGADCRERRRLFCLRGAAACSRGCRKSILRRRPLPASAAVRAVGYCLWQTPSVPPIGCRPAGCVCPRNADGPHLGQGLKFASMPPRNGLSLRYLLAAGVV